MSLNKIYKELNDCKAKMLYISLRILNIKVINIDTFLKLKFWEKEYFEKRNILRKENILNKINNLNKSYINKFNIILH